MHILKPLHKYHMQFRNFKYYICRDTKLDLIWNDDRQCLIWNNGANVKSLLQFIEPESFIVLYKDSLWMKYLRVILGMRFNNESGKTEAYSVKEITLNSSVCTGHLEDWICVLAD